MSTYTDYLNLFMWNPQTDGEEEFDIEKALNENWKKLDIKVKQHILDTAKTILDFETKVEQDFQTEKQVLETELNTYKQTVDTDMNTYKEEINNNLSSYKEAIDAQIEEFEGNSFATVEMVNDYLGDVYDSSKTYAVGDYCIYENTLYKCIVEITTAEVFDSSKWKKTSVDKEIDSIETAIEGKVTNSPSENFAGKWNGYMQDIATENTSDTWLLVANKGKVQHRAIANIINSFALPNLGSVANVLDTTITKGFGTYTVNTSNIPSGFFQYGSVLFLPTASSSPNGHIVMLFGNNESANGRIAITYYVNGEFTGWNYIKTRNNITTGTEIATNEYLDNKQIYQKTIKITSLNSNRTYTHGISNFGELIDIRGTGYWSGQGWQPIQRVVTDGIALYGLGLGDIDATKFMLQVGSSYSGFQKAYITLKYTKK